MAYLFLTAVLSFIGGGAGVLLAVRSRRAEDPMLQAAWGIIANVGGGDWKSQPAQWRHAAETWRDAYLGPT